MTVLQRGVIPPVIDADSETWWAGVAVGRITLPRCMACHAASFPPAPVCPLCGERAGFERIDASGRGRIYSWAVIHLALDPEFAEDVPYTIAVVQLEEGPRVLGRLFGDFDNLMGAAVQPVFYEVRGQHLMGFEVSGR